MRYIFIKKQGLYFVATTCTNVSPSSVVELLFKMAKVSIQPLMVESLVAQRGADFFGDLK